MLIIASEIQWNTTSVLKNGLQDINRPNLHFIDVSGILYQAISWWFSWIVTKFTFVGVILEDTITLHEENNLQHLYIPPKNMDLLG